MAWIVFLGSWKKLICYVILKSGEEIWRRGFTQKAHKLWILSKFGVIKVFFIYIDYFIQQSITLNKLQ